MLRTKAKFTATPQEVIKRSDKSREKMLRRSGALVYKIARNSIRSRKNRNIHSPPGKPPYTHTGLMKRSIRWAVSPDKRSVVIGPTASELGRLGALHEFGGRAKSKVRIKRMPNWKLKVGGHGPIDVSGSVRFAKLRSAEMVRRSREVSLDALRALSVSPEESQAIAKILWSDSKKMEETVKTYPARPFMEPALRVAMTYQDFLSVES